MPSTCGIYGVFTQLQACKYINQKYCRANMSVNRYFRLAVAGAGGSISGCALEFCGKSVFSSTHSEKKTVFSQLNAILKALTTPCVQNKVVTISLKCCAQT